MPPYDAEQMRDYRAGNSDYAERNRQRNKAARAADAALKRLHRAEWERLFAAELKERGIEERR